jgi:hypothetical protein
MTDDENVYLDRDGDEIPQFEMSNLSYVVIAIVLFSGLFLADRAFDKWTRPPTILVHINPLSNPDAYYRNFVDVSQSPLKQGWDYSCLFISPQAKQVVPNYTSECLESFYKKYKELKRKNETTPVFPPDSLHYRSNSGQ